MLALPCFADEETEPVPFDPEIAAMQLDALGKEIARQIGVLKKRAEAGDARGLDEAKQALEELRDRLALLVPQEDPEPRGRRAASPEMRVSVALSDVRSALTLFSAEHGGDYPDTLEVLIPKYLKAVPSPGVASHPGRTPARVLNKLGDKDPLGELKDSGTWLYVSDPESPMFGALLIDCTHHNAQGEEWYKQ